MLDESLRRRLEALNRGVLPQGTKLPSRRAPSPPARQPRPTPSVRRPRDGMLSRAQAVSNDLGEHLLVEIGVDEFWPDASQLLAARHEQLATHPAEDGPADRRGFLKAFPQRFIALDLETCGLSGSALFLAGLARYVDGRPTVELLFARSYAEEAAVLASLGERLTGVDVLVSFNGKSFDWPMVSDRWRRYLLDRSRPLPDLVHYDVLHHSRRRWRNTLPDCKLQTIERLICRRGRTGDIAGHLIPGAYDHYVRTGIETEMEQVLYHNALDLVTLLDVAMRVAG